MYEREIQDLSFDFCFKLTPHEKFKYSLGSTGYSPVNKWITP
jgi:hypothetical protein